MSTTLLTPPTHTSPASVLRISQQAPGIFRSLTPTKLPYPLSLLFSSESAEKWTTLENLLLACLRTGDNESAYLCLEELTDRFGANNERVQALNGLYREATARDDKALEEVLRSYEDVLKETPTNMPIRKRRVALLRSMGRVGDAIGALRELLDASPIDAEAWSELADMYISQGAYSQAIFCLEEVLLITPNAWNIHARLGEATYISANAAESDGDKLKTLSEAMRRFCRSIELCDDYLRGYYGLKLTTSRLLETLNKTSKPASASSNAQGGDLAPPTLSSVQRLNELSTSKLAEIIRRSSAGEKGWDGYDQAEIIATRELLDRDTQTVSR
ncbi:Inositol phosphatase SIW14 [Taxawa tesnikishii (nom. ined.)]|nr:Inositol phosphatase SIW14 [Dothideales sp. JES 119]